MSQKSKNPNGTRKAPHESESDRLLDEALEETFPASDPPASGRTSAGAPDHPRPKRPGRSDGRKKQ